VHVGSEPHVIGEIPADVIRVFIEHDVVGTPFPVATVPDVGRGHAEEKAAKPEPARAASLDPEDMAGAEAARKMAVLPRLGQMEARVVASGVVADPFIVGSVHVWGGGMTGMIAVGAVLHYGFTFAMHGCRPVRRNMAAAYVFVSTHAQRESRAGHKHKKQPAQGGAAHRVFNRSRASRSVVPVSMDESG